MVPSYIESSDLVLNHLYLFFQMQRLEMEMELVFENKVIEKTAKLETTRQELEHQTQEIREQVEAAKLELEERRRTFYEEKKGLATALLN